MKIMAITENEILMGRDGESPLTHELEKNLEKLLKALNQFREIYAKPMIVSSGYRPAQYNTLAGGAKKSNHMLCLACDFVDLDSALDIYCVENQNVLAECGLYLEHPKWTKTWCHLQVISPASGKRIFVPQATEPTIDKLDKLFINLKI